MKLDLISLKATIRLSSFRHYSKCLSTMSGVRRPFVCICRVHRCSKLPKFQTESVELWVVVNVSGWLAVCALRITITAMTIWRCMLLFDDDDKSLLIVTDCCCLLTEISMKLWMIWTWWRLPTATTCLPKMEVAHIIIGIDRFQFHLSVHWIRELFSKYKSWARPILCLNEFCFFWIEWSCACQPLISVFCCW